MPSDVKAVLSAITLAVAAACAWWEAAHGIARLAWPILGLAGFAVIAMWVFPEAGPARRPDARDQDVPGPSVQADS